MDCDNLEGWQVQVGEAGILQVVEVPLCQGVPAHHAHPSPRSQAQCWAPPHTGQIPQSTQLPYGPIIHPARSWGSRARAGTWQPRPVTPVLITSQGSPYRRPLSCAFRLCSNRAASLKDTLRPVELVDRKRSVSAS